VFTAPDIYIRFHGTKRWYRHDYTREELNVRADRIKAANRNRVWGLLQQHQRWPRNQERQNLREAVAARTQLHDVRIQWRGLWVEAGHRDRARADLYRVGKGEQGVLICEPYKSELLPLWRFRKPNLARESSEAILQIQELPYR
jgi:hypothetical protein